MAHFKGKMAVLSMIYGCDGGASFRATGQYEMQIYREGLYDGNHTILWSKLLLRARVIRVIPCAEHRIPIHIAVWGRLLITS